MLTTGARGHRIGPLQVKDGFPRGFTIITTRSFCSRGKLAALADSRPALWLRKRNYVSVVDIMIV
jgi:hypothetical protein